MRILHTSDWHLGRSFHGEGLGEAHEAYLDHLVELAHDSKPDAIVVSGDIYDRALPAPTTVALLDDALNRLLATGTRVILTSGNHDSAIRLGFASRVMENSGLSIRTNYSSVADPVTVRSRSTGEVAGHVITVPYLEPALAVSFFEAAEPTHAHVLASAFTRGLEACPDDGLPLVGMAHAFFQNATPSESERDVTVGGLGQAPLEVLAGLDYAALGHLHGHQRLGPRARYSGSPVAMSFSEAGHTKGTVLATITKESAECEFVPAPVVRPLRVLRGELASLLSDPTLKSAQDAWCQVTLTDAIRPEAAMDRLRERFPHTLRLLFDTPAREAQHATYAQRLTGRSPMETCCDFLEHVRGGRGPSAGERELLDTAIADAMKEN